MADKPKTTHSDHTPKQIALTLDRLGLPGFPCTIVVQPHYPGNDPRNRMSPAGIPGQYQVTFILARPGRSLGAERTVLWAEQLQGDSHLQIARPACQRKELSDISLIRLETMKDDLYVYFTGHPNDDGFLGKLISDPFHASSSKDARSTAFKLLTPWFSRMAFELDIPLNIFSQETCELLTGTRSLTFVSPQIERCLATSDAASGTAIELQLYNSIFREALTSQAPVYQFFCYYRIIEGITVRRARICQAAIASKQAPLRQERIRIPGDTTELRRLLSTAFCRNQEWEDITVDMVFPTCCRGRKVLNIVENTLRPLRDKVAHMLLDAGEPSLNLDDAADCDEVLKWLPFSKLIARLMYLQEFSHNERNPSSLD